MLIKIAILFVLIHAVHCAEVKAKVCPLESSCGKPDESSAICRFDEQNNCIRKYDSKCHMDVEACKAGKNYTDYSDVYCLMETYICEEMPSYERWTIFFGNVKS